MNSGPVVRGRSLVGNRRLGPLVTASVVPTHSTQFLGLEVLLSDLFRTNVGGKEREQLGGEVHKSLLYLAEQLRNDGIA